MIRQLHFCRARGLTHLGAALLMMVLLSPEPVLAQDRFASGGATYLADEPWLSPSQDEPSGGISENLRLPPGMVRSPAVALLLPLTLTIAPVIAGVGLFAADSEQARHVGFVVMNTGLLLGPSLGHFYAGEVRHGLLTLGIRGALVGGSIALYAAALGSTPDRPMTSYDDDSAGIMLLLAFTLAIGAFGVGIYDLVDAPLAANRTNAKLLVSSVAVAPMIIRRDNESQLGLMVSARF